MMVEFASKTPEADVASLTDAQKQSVYVAKGGYNLVLKFVKPSLAYDLETAKGVRDFQAWLQSKVGIGKQVGFFYDFTEKKLEITCEANTDLALFKTITESKVIV
jgi:hypothetical protein